MSVRLLAPVLALLLAAAACGSADDGAGADVDRLGDVLVERALGDGVPGVSVAVVADGGAITTAVGGLADAERDIAVASDTLFHAGSTHKALNAFFVATLVDDGTLAWDDPVVDLLDRPAASAAVPDLDDAHEAYLEAFDERVLRPLGMDDTWLLASEARATGRLSRSHELIDGEPVVLDSVDLDADVLLPSGGLKTTATDLGRFLAAMLDDGGGVISPDAVERLWTPGLGDDAMGWERSIVDGLVVWSHEGSFDGFLSVIAVVPEAGVGVVVLANTEDAAADVIGAAPGELARAAIGP